MPADLRQSNRILSEANGQNRIRSNSSILFLLWFIFHQSHYLTRLDHSTSNEEKLRLTAVHVVKMPACQIRMLGKANKESLSHEGNQRSGKIVGRKKADRPSAATLEFLS
jgi:hypothetical protein